MITYTPNPSLLVTHSLLLIILFLASSSSIVCCDFTSTMVGTRKAPSGRATLPLDRSSGFEVVGDEFGEDAAD
jgi:hypothetical protein